MTGGSAVPLPELRALARLASLDPDALPPDTEAELRKVLTWLQFLQGVPTVGVEPMVQPVALPSVLRPDAAAPAANIDALLANAPARDGDWFVVPRRVGGGDDVG